MARHTKVEEEEEEEEEEERMKTMGNPYTT